MTRSALWLLTAMLAIAAAAQAAQPAPTNPKDEAKPAPAAEKPDEKAAETKPDADTPLTVTVTMVEGTVETRPAVSKPWAPLKAGMQLAVGTDIRTGFRARCILDLVDSLVQIDPLTVVRIGELAREGGKVRTRFIMKQGHTQAIVEKPAMESDFAIVTPSATLSVRGTQGVNGGFFPVWGGTYGLVGPGLISVMNNQIGSQAYCGPGQKTDDNTTPPGQILQQGFLPIILPQGGLGKQEKSAAGRWNTSQPFPAGLGGPGGPPNFQSKGGSQQTDPNDNRTPGNPTGEERHDITNPPYEPQ